MNPLSIRDDHGLRARSADLVARALDGDPEAWTAIVGQFDGLLRSVAHRFRLGPDDAHDAVQVTWLRLFENLHKIRDHERLAGWLSITMRRECIRVYNRRTGEWLTGDFAEIVFVDAEGADVEALRAEEARLLWEAVDRLPDRQRVLLRLLFEGPVPPSYEEVGATLSLAIGSVGPCRMRALHRLRELLLEADALDTLGDSVVCA